MRRFIVVVSSVLFATIFAGGALLYADYAGAKRADVKRAEFEDEFVARLDDALRRQDEAFERMAARFEAVDDLKTAQELRLSRYRNADHLRNARALGVGRVSGMDQVERLVAENRLVELGDTEYYYLQEFDYSIPYVTPATARLLEIIGGRLHAELHALGLPLYRFNVSSVLRTAENQRALRRINPNAALGVSTHEFGTTLDVVYHIYEYVPKDGDALPVTEFESLNARLESMRVRRYEALGMRYWRQLQGLLGRVLIDLQDEGKVIVTLERQQPVFHLTLGSADPR